MLGTGAIRLALDDGRQRGRLLRIAAWCGGYCALMLVAFAALNRDPPDAFTLTLPAMAALFALEAWLCVCAARVYERGQQPGRTWLWGFAGAGLFGALPLMAFGLIVIRLVLTQSAQTPALSWVFFTGLCLALAVHALMQVLVFIATRRANR